MSVRGCSGRVLSASFRELPPGGHFVAESGRITPTGNGKELRFGALFFQRIPAGPITVRAEFVSRTDSSDDAGRIEGVWLGRIEADPLVLADI